MQTIPDEIRPDVETLWNYHRIDDQLEPVDVAVGLGSHDPSVAIYTAELYAKALFPLIVFTGANAPTTVERFPRGEAVHYREIALDHGVPDEAILVEPNARHTGQNIDYARQLLDDRGSEPRSVLLISRPYQQRRALATALKRWPGVEIRCSATAQTLDEYTASIGDVRRVVDMLVGDTQRITYYAERGEAAPQDVPRDVHEAYERLVAAGFTSRLLE
ncbi:MAG: YdcF family protein [Actinophytocola sp.]|nr:YdcF family protein [Actinophytocola sp.]